MKQELRLFFTALMFFTRIPCARWAGSSEDHLNRASRYFPLVGIIVGLVAASAYLAAKLVFPQEVAVLASMAATLWLTGAFHEDGLADRMLGPVELEDGLERRQRRRRMRRQHGEQLQRG